MKLIFLNAYIGCDIQNQCFATLEHETGLRVGDQFPIYNGGTVEIIDYFSKSEEFVLHVLCSKEKTLYFNTEKAFLEELKEIEKKKIISSGTVKYLTNTENYYITYYHDEKKGKLFEKEWIKGELWACYDYLGEDFVSIAEFKTLKEAMESIEGYKVNNFLDAGETATAEMVRGTPTLIIVAKGVEQNIVEELKTYFADERRKKNV